MGLQTVVANCRHDLDGIRRETDDSVAAEAVVRIARLEERLSEVADRIEAAAGVFDRVVDGQDGGPDDVMAREADHRIKNSLQTVMALLHQQAMRTESEEARQSLRVANGRVAAVAQVHAALHASAHDRRGPAVLELQTFLNGLCGALSEAAGVDGGHRVLRVNVAPLEITPAIAQSLGLIVSELVMNAFRHAFHPDRAGTVWVCGADLGHGRYALSVSDDGRGLPRGFDLRLRPSGLGLRLVNRLADQLKATVSVTGKGGARFSINLPVGVAGA